MPQMFPLFWFILFGLAAVSLLVTSSMIHFLQETKVSMKISACDKTSHNWKW